MQLIIIIISKIIIKIIFKAKKSYKITKCNKKIHLIQLLIIIIKYL